MDLSRRHFLGGALAVAGASVVTLPALADVLRPAIPIIWGDGIHDDAPGLNALCAGEPVDVAEDIARLSQSNGIMRIWIGGGRTYRMASPLCIRDRKERYINISGATFLLEPEVKTGIYLLSCGNIRLDFEIKRHVVESHSHMFDLAGYRRITVANTTGVNIRI
jgi:hypothetical protein